MKNKITAKEFDKKFDEGEDISSYIDQSSGVKRVNVDFPLWVVKALDKEAARVGVTRQSLIKSWVVNFLDQRESKAAVFKKAN